MSWHNKGAAKNSSQSIMSSLQCDPRGQISGPDSVITGTHGQIRMRYVLPWGGGAGIVLRSVSERRGSPRALGCLQQIWPLWVCRVERRRKYVFEELRWRPLCGDSRLGLQQVAVIGRRWLRSPWACIRLVTPCSARRSTWCAWPASAPIRWAAASPSGVAANWRASSWQRGSAWTSRRRRCDGFYARTTSSPGAIIFGSTQEPPGCRVLCHGLREICAASHGRHTGHGRMILDT